MADPPVNLDMEALRNYCLTYNRGNQPSDIEIEEIRNDRLALITALWMRDITIPITIFGEPYDKCFSEFISLDITLLRMQKLLFRENFRYPKAKETLLYRFLALSFTDLTVNDKEFTKGTLIGFLTIFLPTRDKTMNEKISYVDLIVRPLMEEKKKDKINKIRTSLGIEFTETKELIKHLPSLSLVSLVYLLINFLDGNDIINNDPTIRQYLNMVEAQGRKNEFYN